MNNKLFTLTFRSGKKARALIARDDLRPELIKMIAGADVLLSTAFSRTISTKLTDRILRYKKE